MCAFLLLIWIANKYVKYLLSHFSVSLVHCPLTHCTTWLLPLRLTGVKSSAHLQDTFLPVLDLLVIMVFGSSGGEGHSLDGCAIFFWKINHCQFKYQNMHHLFYFNFFMFDLPDAIEASAKIRIFHPTVFMFVVCFLRCVNKFSKTDHNWQLKDQIKQFIEEERNNGSSPGHQLIEMSLSQTREQGRTKQFRYNDEA